MRKGINKQLNGFLSNPRNNIVRYNLSGIITNNQNYLNMISDYSWEPPADWLQLPRPLENEQKFIGLLAIIQGASGATAANADSNFIALTCQGNYIVDWGNGVTSAHTSSTRAQYQYNYADIPNSTLTTDGFKQVIIQAYPQTGATLTSVNIQQNYTLTGVTLNSNYVSAWLDIKVVGRNISSLTIGASSRITTLSMLKRVELVGTSQLTDASNLFNGCFALEKVIGPRFTENCTAFLRTFNACNALTYVDLLDTRKATNAEFMFDSCWALQTAPPIDLSNSTNSRYLFASNFSLRNVPFLNLSRNTNFDNFFSGCFSLKRIPEFLNTSSGTNFSSMFNNCASLEEIPFIDTSNATSMSQFASTTRSLKKLPQLNTSNVTTFSNAFSNSGIFEFPSWNVSKSTNFNRTFFLAGSLQRVKGLTFSSANNCTEMFYQNGCLIEVGPFDFSGVTSGSTAAGATGVFNSFFFQTPALSNVNFTGLQKSIDISGQVLSGANLNYLFDNLANVTGTGATITITNNWGVASCDRTKATSKGWTVIG